MANFATYNWEFRPVLAPEDISNYAAHAEYGFLYTDFAKIRPQIGPEEKVLLLGCTYPFYLHRDVRWNDEAVGAGGLKSQWKDITLPEARQWLAKEKIDYLICAGRRTSNDPCRLMAANLESSGSLTKLRLDDEPTTHGFDLFKVNRAKIASR